MSKTAPVENKMGVMPVVPLIFNMALPMMVSMLVMALYNIVDSIFVAKINEEALTAVSLAFPIQNLMISFGVGTSIGVNALMSMRLGQQRQDDVDKSAMNGVFLAFCTYALFVLVSLTCVTPYLNSQTQNASIVQYGQDYMAIIMILGFGMFGQIMFERMLQATGRTFFSMISQLAGSVVNLVFDPILIFGIGPFPCMGIKGAALATVMGQIVGMLISICLNIKYNHDLNIKIKNLIPDLNVIKEIYKVGVPSIALSSITSVITYFVNLIIGGISNGGDTAIAVYGVYFKLNSFIFMPVFGLNNGIVPIIAYNYGARHHKRITNTIRAALVIAFIIMSLGVVLFETIPGRLFAMFNASDDMLRIGIPALRIIAPSFFGAAIAITLSSVFQAFGDAVYSMTVSFARQFILFLPSAYFLGKTGNVDNVWWCFIIAEFMSVAASLFFMKKLYNNKIKNLPEA